MGNNTTEVKEKDQRSWLLELQDSITKVEQRQAHLEELVLSYKSTLDAMHNLLRLSQSHAEKQTH